MLSVDEIILFYDQFDSPPTKEWIEENNPNIYAEVYVHQKLGDPSTLSSRLTRERKGIVRSAVVRLVYHDFFSEQQLREKYPRAYDYLMRRKVYDLDWKKKMKDDFAKRITGEELDKICAGLDGKSLYISQLRGFESNKIVLSEQAEKLLRSKVI